MAIFKKYRHSREGVVITLKIGGGKKNIGCYVGLRELRSINEL